MVDDICMCDLFTTVPSSTVQSFMLVNRGHLGILIGIGMTRDDEG